MLFSDDSGIMIVNHALENDGQVGGGGKKITRVLETNDDHIDVEIEEVIFQGSGNGDTWHSSKNLGSNRFNHGK